MIRASMDMKEQRRPSATVMAIVGGGTTLVATLGLYGIGKVNWVQSQSLRRLSIESSLVASSVTATVSITAPTMSPTAVIETPSTSPTTISTAVSSESFRLRLHWQPDYYWQETRNESWFCAACAICNPNELFGGRKNCALQLDCKEDHTLALWGCDPSKPLHKNITEFVKLKNGSPAPFDMATDGFNGDQIQAQGTNLCLTKLNGASLGYTSMSFKPCNSTIKQQQFFGTRAGIGQAMEVQPFPADGRLCMANHHHPLPQEQIYAESCDFSRIATNNLWCPFSSLADNVGPPCTPTPVTKKPNTKKPTSTKPTLILPTSISPTTSSPTAIPTAIPSKSPKGTPTAIPTARLSKSPTGTPTAIPTARPTKSSLPITGVPTLTKPTTIKPTIITSKRPSSKKPVTRRPMKKLLFQ